MESFFGTLTAIFAVGMILWGVPMQIWKHYKDKRCGFTLSMLVIMMGLLISRTTYAVLIRSWFIAIPDAIGITLFIVISVQYYLYEARKRK